MALDRRSFIKGLFAAPAIVAIGNIMPVRALAALLPPMIIGDGVHDDAEGLNALLSGKPVDLSKCGASVLTGPNHVWISDGVFLLGQPLIVDRDRKVFRDIVVSRSELRPAKTLPIDAALLNFVGRG